MTLGKRLRLESLWVHTSSEHSLGVHPLGDAFLPTKLRNAISCRGLTPLPGLSASREILGCPLVCLGQRSQGSFLLVRDKTRVLQSNLPFNHP